MANEIILPVTPEVRRDALSLHVREMDRDPEGESWRWKYIRALSAAVASDECR